MVMRLEDTLSLLLAVAFTVAFLRGQYYAFYLQGEARERRRVSLNI